MKKARLSKELKATPALTPPPTGRGKLAEMGGSRSDAWNCITANQALQTCWRYSDEEERHKQDKAVVAGLKGIAPRDEIEGMIAAQMIGAHNAAMECLRRAMLPEQTSDGRHENLRQASKLSRTFAALVEALDRHRGKGQQKVVVEHVHIHSGAQAIVGNVNRGGGGAPELEGQSHEKQLAHASVEPLPSEVETVRETVRRTGS